MAAGAVIGTRAQIPGSFPDHRIPAGTGRGILMGTTTTVPVPASMAVGAAAVEVMAAAVEAEMAVAAADQAMLNFLEAAAFTVQSP